MTFAIDRPIQQTLLSFDQFLAQYGGDKRYELIDGEVFDLEPTGPLKKFASKSNSRKSLDRSSTSPLQAAAHRYDGISSGCGGDRSD
jgi:hypothetical protein